MTIYRFTALFIMANGLFWQRPLMTGTGIFMFIVLGWIARTANDIGKLSIADSAPSWEAGVSLPVRIAAVRRWHFPFRSNRRSK